MITTPGTHPFENETSDLIEYGQLTPLAPALYSNAYP